MLIIFTTLQIILISSEKNALLRSQEHFIYDTFLEEGDKRDVDYSKIAYLYNVRHIRDHINQTLNNFYKIKENSLELIEYLDENIFTVLEFEYINPEIVTDYKTGKTKFIKILN